jgi:two-component system sensor histidine kinase MtrB
MRSISRFPDRRGTAAPGHRRVPRRAVAVWRASLQLRVVTLTLLASAGVVAVLGVILVGQVRDGLLAAKTRAALAEANAGVLSARTQLDAAEHVDGPARAALLDEIVDSLASRGGHAGLYEVVLLPGRQTTDAAGSARGSNHVLPASVPPGVRRAVVEGGRQVHAYTRLRYADGRTEPGLVVGAPVPLSGGGGVGGGVSGGSYQLYHLFPLRQEAQTLSLVQRTAAFAGAGLVLLLAAVAWIVTRLVVTPVRLAARTAERLAAGRLDQRMLVRGEDDLARLAWSFNRMAENLQRQIRQLEELSRVQRRFVSDVSHELRTPLATVRMAADVLHESRSSFDPGAARAAELLQAQLDRFEALLVDLLEISRYDAGAASLDAEPVDVRTLAHRVVDVCLPLAERRGIAVRLELPPGACLAEVDPRRVERVLRNLVVNAIDHGEGRDVVVRMACDETAVAVTVRDHGVGLSLDDCRRVFDRFWRADPARARATGGTGLGLAIAREDAHLHGGWLQAWGEPGAGCNFRLTLPRRAGVELVRSPLPLRPPDARPPVTLTPGVRRT